MIRRKGGMRVARKISALLTLAVFILISTACVTWSRKEVKTLTSPIPEGTAVLSVVKNSGQVIEFTKTNPGRIRGYTVVGAGKDAEMKQFEITAPFTSIRQGDKGQIVELVDGKGQGYVVKAVLSGDEYRMTILGVESNRLTIPLKEIATVRIRKDNALAVTAIVLGAIVVLPVLITLVAYSIH